MALILLEADRLEKRSVKQSAVSKRGVGQYLTLAQDTAIGRFALSSTYKAKPIGLEGLRPAGLLF